LLAVGIVVGVGGLGGLTVERIEATVGDAEARIAAADGPAPNALQAAGRPVLAKLRRVPCAVAARAAPPGPILGLCRASDPSRRRGEKHTKKGKPTADTNGHFSVPRTCSGSGIAISISGSDLLSRRRGIAHPRRVPSCPRSHAERGNEG